MKPMTSIWGQGAREDGGVGLGGGGTFLEQESEVYFVCKEKQEKMKKSYVEPV